MSALEIVGLVTVSIIAIGMAMIAYVIAGNIYGGIKGAYRLRAIKGRYKKKATHWRAIRLGLRNWHGGNRYKNGYGSYWRLGGLIVPIDGRDKLSRERFYGA